MLKSWLKESKIASQKAPFTLFQAVEATPPTEGTRNFLQQQLRFNAFDPAFLADLASELGWNTVENAVVGGMTPRLAKTKRGRFGEALACCALIELHGYLVPIPKHQHLLSPDQSLPATDAIAIKLKDGAIIEACFVESKLRTCVDTSAAVHGCEQLQADYSKKIPYILIFTSQQLHQQKSDLFKGFASYLRNRTDDPNLDAFRLFLVFDPAYWSAKTLDNLADSGVALEPLGVHLVHINGLAALVDDVYARAGLPIADADE